MKQRKNMFKFKTVAKLKNTTCQFPVLCILKLFKKNIYHSLDITKYNKNQQLLTIPNIENCELQNLFYRYMYLDLLSIEK